MSALPRHIGIIMDGNGRWAQMRSRPRTFGHIKGARVAKRIITHCAKIGIETVTMFAFSTENWLRPQTEVTFLMNLLRKYLKRETENLFNENIKFTTIGDLSRLPSDLIEAIKFAQTRTQDNTGLNLVFAINYGGRQEITDAVKALALKVKEGSLDPNEIDEPTVAFHMQTFPARDPDMIIRTSGEQRLSNFLMWQSAYSELYFTDILWPDFSTAEFDRALNTFQQRDRRYGQVSSAHLPSADQGPLRR